MTPFEKALKFTLQWEGGYSNHPADKGGATNKGITQTTYNSYRSRKGLPVQSVLKITDQEVHDIYKKHYWDSAGCDVRSEPLAIALFDFAVNSGVSRAKDYLAQSGNDLKNFLDARESFFRRIGTGKQRVFLKGWLSRLNSLRKYLGVQ